MPFQVAIDGPVAAGKSTVAKLLAQQLSFTYIDTGAMYRAVALAAQRKGISWQDSKALGELAAECKLRLARPIGDKNDGRFVSVYLGDEDVSWLIRTPEIAEGASQVSQFPQVRKVLVSLQQQMADDRDVVMEGRDIGTKVLPKAQLKIFMFADLKERVKRKQLEMASRGEDRSSRVIKKEIEMRDNREMSRKASPLKPARGAWMFDTTHLEIPEVVSAIVERVKSLYN